MFQTSAKAKSLAALGIIVKAGHENHVDAAVAGGGVGAMIKVLEHGSDDAKGIAVAILRSITEVEKHVAAVVASGGVAALNRVLDEGPDVFIEFHGTKMSTKSNAAHALGLMAEATGVLMYEY